jgi:hypothetical protein
VHPLGLLVELKGFDVDAKSNKCHGGFSFKTSKNSQKKALILYRFDRQCRQKEYEGV